jgi:sugar lactone lactonase YvrE
MAESINIECITGDLHCDLGEGPIYDERVDTVYVVDINSGSVWSIDGAKARRRVFASQKGEPVGCAFLTSDPSKLLVATARHILLVDLCEGEDQDAQILGTLPANMGASDDGSRFNDGKITPDGSHAILGHLSLSWRSVGGGGLVAFDSTSCTFRDITPLQGIGCPNGMVWKGGKFLIVDSRDESVREYETDEHGVPDTTSSNRLVRQTETQHAHVPDGMALDDDGNVWIAIGESGEVRCYDGQTGEEIRSVALPIKRPTSCNFGGKHLEVLYVTSRVEKPGVEQSPQHGGVFAVTGLGVRGAAHDANSPFLENEEPGHSQKQNESTYCRYEILNVHSLHSAMHSFIHAVVADLTL